jgi:hypothetical protein
MADLTRDWKHSFVEIFDPTLLIPRDEVEESADDSNGMRTGVESVYSTFLQRYSRRCA